MIITVHSMNSQTHLLTVLTKSFPTLFMVITVHTMNRLNFNDYYLFDIIFIYNLLYCFSEQGDL